VLPSIASEGIQDSEVTVLSCRMLLSLVRPPGRGPACYLAFPGAGGGWPGYGC